MIESTENRTHRCICVPKKVSKSDTTSTAHWKSELSCPVCTNHQALFAGTLNFENFRPKQASTFYKTFWYI